MILFILHSVMYLLLITIILDVRVKVDTFDNSMKAVNKERWGKK